MWEIEISEIYEQKLRGFKKKHSDILQALQYNANSYHRLLNEGKTRCNFKKAGSFIPRATTACWRWTTGTLARCTDLDGSIFTRIQTHKRCILSPLALRRHSRKT